MGSASHEGLGRLPATVVGNSVGAIASDDMARPVAQALDGARAFEIIRVLAQVCNGF